MIKNDIHTLWFSCRLYTVIKLLIWVYCSFCMTVCSHFQHMINTNGPICYMHTLIVLLGTCLSTWPVRNICVSTRLSLIQSTFGWKSIRRSWNTAVQACRDKTTLSWYICAVKWNINVLTVNWEEFALENEQFIFKEVSDNFSFIVWYIWNIWYLLGLLLSMLLSIY